MNDETDTARAEGEALPASGGFVGATKGEPPSIVSTGYPMRADQVAKLAIERWYAAHFHACAVAGRVPLSADDKAALVKSVADAVAPATKE